MRLSPSHVARLEQFLDRLASDVYAEPPSELHTQITSQMVARLVSAHPLPARARILDVGCGQGLALRIFAALGHEPVGITLGTEDLQACRQQGLTVHLMDESFLDFDEEAFDLVWCRHALEHSVLPYFTVSGFVRILKPGGILYVEVPAPDTPCRHQTNPNHYSVLGRSMWTELLTRAGLVVLEAMDLTLETGAGPDVYWAFFAQKPAPVTTVDPSPIPQAHAHADGTELDLEARIARGEELMGTDVPAALGVFEEILGKHPLHVRALSDAGVACFQLDRPDEACRLLATALAVEPSANVVVNLFHVLLAASRFDAAAELLATRGSVLDATDLASLVRHVETRRLQAEGNAPTSSARRLPLRSDSLAAILDTEIGVDVVDVGANFLGDPPPYHALLEGGRARLVGFEPNPDALAVLEARKGPHEVYLPHAVGDGRTHTLRLCAMSGMSSLLPPNFALLDLTHFHGGWARIEREVEVRTHRLDDLTDVPALDYLKIDIQGGEMMVFEGASSKLARCLVIHTETMFVPMYVDQPLFSEQERFLRALGFQFHRFYQAPGFPSPIIGHTLKPLIVNGDPHGPCSQVFWADSVFIPDLTRLEALDSPRLLKLGLILHDVYGSLDVVLRCLTVHDQRYGTCHAPRYLEAISREG